MEAQERKVVARLTPRNDEEERANYVVKTKDTPPSRSKRQTRDT